MKRIAPSILAANFARLQEEVQAVEAAGADWIHVDVMDGHFVPNLTIGPPVIETVRHCTDLPLDVHLMITNPERYIAAYAAAGANHILVHQETCAHLHAVVQEIRRHNARPGVVLNPATPLCAAEDILPEIDILLLMTVNPGFGGQRFIESTVEKIRNARHIVDDRAPDVTIEIDGGIKTENVSRASRAGADVFVVGTGIFESDDYAERIGEIRRAAGTADAVESCE